MLIKICFVLFPRLISLLFFLLQQTLWQNGFFLAGHPLLLGMLIADALTSSIYLIIIGKKNLKVHARLIVDAIFFFYSVILFYFMDFTISTSGLFARSANPYENILLLVILQLVSLGFTFFKLVFRVTPENFVKRPYIPLALSVCIYVTCLALRDMVIQPFLIFVNSLSIHLAFLNVVFYCIAVFYLFFTGLWLCYKKYIKPHPLADTAAKTAATLGLPLVILLLTVFKNINLFNPYSFVDTFGSGLILLVLKYNLIWICFFVFTSILIASVVIRVKQIQRVIFVLLCFCFPVNLYLTLVLLPVFSIIFFISIYQPLTLLYFFPYLLLFFHGQALFQTGHAFMPKVRTPRFVFGFVSRIILLMSILPAFVIINGFLDKAELHKAYLSMYDSRPFIYLDRNRLQSVLAEFTIEKRNSYTPFITPLRKAIVLENKELNDQESRRMYGFYFGAMAAENSLQNQVIWPRKVGTDSIREIAFSTHNSYLESKVLIQVENQTQTMDEFYVRFELPRGVFVTGLSLWINGSEKQGLVAKKEPALTVYNQISRRLKDPALLLYEDDGSCSLRIFPVQGGEKRQAAITLIYQEPFELSFGRHKIKIGHSLSDPAWTEKGKKQMHIPVFINNAIFKKQKQDVLHFIIDRSNSADISMKQIAYLIHSCVKKLNWKKQILYTAANYNWKSYSSLDELLQDSSIKKQGSFVYSRVMHGLLYEDKNSDFNPLFIIISSKKEEWLIHPSLLPCKFNFPAFNKVFRLDSTGNLFVFSPFNIYSEERFSNVFYSNQAVILPLEQQPVEQQGSLLSSVSNYSEKKTEKLLAELDGKNKWEQSILVFALWGDINYTYPGNLKQYRQLNLFTQKQGILLPSLSYIVLEDGEQEALLKKFIDSSIEGGLLQTSEFKTVGMDEDLNLIGTTMVLLIITFFTRLYVKKK